MQQVKLSELSDDEIMADLEAQERGDATAKCADTSCLASDSPLCGHVCRDHCIFVEQGLVQSNSFDELVDAIAERFCDAIPDPPIWTRLSRRLGKQALASRANDNGTRRDGRRSRTTIIAGRINGCLS